MIYPELIRGTGIDSNRLSEHQGMLYVHKVTPGLINQLDVSSPGQLLPYWTAHILARSFFGINIYINLLAFRPSQIKRCSFFGTVIV